MRLLLFLFLPLSLLSHTFSVASYNLFNLFDATCDGTEYEDFKHPKWSETKYLKKLNDMAFVIKDMDADIIALQEVENENALLDLKALLPQYKYHAIDTKKGSAISVALLSKYPIKKSQKISVDGARDILKAVVKVDSNPFAIYINHWPSLKSSEIDRIAYAEALIEAISKSAYKEYILVGDFNSNYDRYLHSPAPVAINHTLNTIDGKAFYTKENLSDDAHYNLWLDLEAKKDLAIFIKGAKTPSITSFCQKVYLMEEELIM